MVSDIEAFDGFGPGVCGLFVHVFWMDEGCICYVSYVRLVYALDASHIPHKLVCPDESMLNSPSQTMSHFTPSKPYTDSWHPKPRLS